MHRIKLLTPKDGYRYYHLNSTEFTTNIHWQIEPSIINDPREQGFVAGQVGIPKFQLCTEMHSLKGFDITNKKILRKVHIFIARAYHRYVKPMLEELEEQNEKKEGLRFLYVNPKDVTDEMATLWKDIIESKPAMKSPETLERTIQEQVKRIILDKRDDKKIELSKTEEGRNRLKEVINSYYEYTGEDPTKPPKDPRHRLEMLKEQIGSDWIDKFDALDFSIPNRYDFMCDIQSSVSTRLFIHRLTLRKDELIKCLAQNAESLASGERTDHCFQNIFENYIMWECQLKKEAQELADRLSESVHIAKQGNLTLSSIYESLKVFHTAGKTLLLQIRARAEQAFMYRAQKPTLREVLLCYKFGGRLLPHIFPPSDKVFLHPFINSLDRLVEKLDLIGAEDKIDLSLELSAEVLSRLSPKEKALISDPLAVLRQLKKDLSEWFGYSLEPGYSKKAYLHTAIALCQKVGGHEDGIGEPETIFDLGRLEEYYGVGADALAKENITYNRNKRKFLIGDEPLAELILSKRIEWHQYEKELFFGDKTDFDDSTIGNILAVCQTIE